MKTCTKCQQSFAIRDEDRIFYDQVSPIIGGQKYSIPDPTHCPDCRHQRRLAFRNERNLYWRTCDGTGERILSVFHPDRSIKAYKVDYWYSDAWDPLEHGRDFDFSRPFFEQFKELIYDVPQLSRSVTANENCDYVNQCGWCKDCYLVFEANDNQDCMYGNYISESKDCVDGTMVINSQLCYECVTVIGSYNLNYSIQSGNCSDSWFLLSCRACRDCFGCVNLTNKQYCFFNEQLSKEEYEKRMSQIDLSDRNVIQEYFQKFIEFQKTQPHKYLKGVKVENSTGNYLVNTQNCFECFDVTNSQDCAYVGYGHNLKKVYDMNVFGASGVEFCYEVHEVGDKINNVLFTEQCWSDCHNILYSKLCLNNSHDLFGCVGLKKKSYCILNKQYSKEEYEELVPKIIEHMKKTGEWGEFFPIELSTFAYNETLAQEYFPLEKEAIEKSGWQWREEEIEMPHVEKKIEAHQVPEKIADVPDDILNWAIVCEVTGKPFRITRKELEFYRKKNLPIPRRHSDQRHLDRLKFRASRKLRDDRCDNCSTDLRTVYSRESGQKIYCERCYFEVLS